MNVVLDENEYYVWYTDKQDKIIKQHEKTIAQADSALIAAKDEAILANDRANQESIMRRHVETKNVDLNLQHEKDQRKITRNRLMVVGAAIGGVLVGIIIAK